MDLDLCAGGLFKATVAEYNNPGNLGGPLMPEQLALPGAVGNPTLGLVTAGAITGGLGLAGGGTAALIAGGADAYAAYKAATAAYWVGTALGAGMAVGGGSYAGSAALSAAYDQYRNVQSFGASFDQRFSYSGLAAATVVGGLTGMYGTAMFGWAGVPNSLTNVATLPGFIIRLNSGATGKAAGSAAQAAVKPSNQ